MLIPKNRNINDDHYETLVGIQSKAERTMITLRNYNSIPLGSSVVVQREDRILWTHGTKEKNGPKPWWPCIQN